MTVKIKASMSVSGPTTAFTKEPIVVPSRYRQSRTLVRRLCRLPGETRADFRRKVLRLREHFERFNVDVSDLCQWLMGLRPKDRDGDPGVPTFWHFFLTPSVDGVDADESERDRCRLAVFDAVAGIRSEIRIGDQSLSQALKDAVSQVAQRPKTVSTQQLFERMRGLDPAHRLVLTKSAAEWIVARYQHGVENWQRQRAEWEKEKQEWEGRHPVLRQEICEQFTQIFKSLVWDPEKPPGVKNKRPRICPYERLKVDSDNCIYAGEKGHGPLCWKYATFVRDQKKQNGKFNEKHFCDNAEMYLRFRNTRDRVCALQCLHREVPQCKRWFETAWNAYLKALELNEETAVTHGQLPHCRKIGETWEESKCQRNPHTELCRQYKNKLSTLDADTLKLEADYRQWRRNFLAGPSKPSFRYPSSRTLPMPKIFGDRFHEIDLERSVIRLRLDDMPEGESIEFGFIPWPRGYHPRRSEVLVTSVHVNFVGSRARVGFRFDVPHRESRFRCTQDELDELRSRTYPRQAQDQQFLDAARQRLLESFSGGAETDLRILAVDLGETGAHTAVYVGRRHQLDVPLRIVKIDQRYEGLPEVLEKDKLLENPPKFDPKTDLRGLRKEHVGRHLNQLADGAAKISEHRQTIVAAPVTLRDSDFRGLTSHIRWMIRDWVRHNAAQIVAAAEEHHCDLIVFESLRGFMPPGYEKLDVNDQRKKRWLAMFAYGRIRRKVVEKAVERGMRVVTVPYFKSSQFCSACGHPQENEGRWRKNKRVHRFECECGGPRPSHGKRPAPKSDRIPPKNNADLKCSCNLKLDSDANAARVVAHVFWGEICLPSPED